MKRTATSPLVYVFKGICFSSATLSFQNIRRTRRWSTQWLSCRPCVSENYRFVPSNYYKSNESLTYLVMFIESFFLRYWQPNTNSGMRWKLCLGFSFICSVWSFFFFFLAYRPGTFVMMRTRAVKMNTLIAKIHLNKILMTCFNPWTVYTCWYLQKRQKSFCLKAAQA